MRSRARMCFLLAPVLLASLACSLGRASLSLPREATPSSAVDSGSQIPTPEAAAGIWVPAPGTSWQWQLSGLPVDLGVEAEVYDLDLFETDSRTIADLSVMSFLWASARRRASTFRAASCRGSRRTPTSTRFFLSERGLRPSAFFFSTVRPPWS